MRQTENQIEIRAAMMKKSFELHYNGGTILPISRPGQIRRIKRMFSADMIAPCGLDCSICKHALAETSPCAGCRGPNDNKPDFCSVGCGIILCDKRKANG